MDEPRYRIDKLRNEWDTPKRIPTKRELRLRIQALWTAISVLQAEIDRLEREMNRPLSGHQDLHR